MDRFQAAPALVRAPCLRLDDRGGAKGSDAALRERRVADLCLVSKQVSTSQALRLASRRRLAESAAYLVAGTLEPSGFGGRDGGGERPR